MDLDGATDSELIEYTRGGNTEAYGELWVRHERSALAYAHSLSSSCADDLVAEAFARILRVLQRGQGPVDNFRAYLCSAIKSCFIDEYRRSRRSTSIGHDEILDALSDQSVEHVPAELEVDGDAVRSAWSKLARREQWLMWASAVQGYSTGEIAEQLGVKPGTAAVWVYRARERTRIAFLASHVPAAANALCQQQRDRFVGYVRDTLSDRRREQVSEHLDMCGDCRDAFGGVARVNHRMRAVVWPLLPPSTTGAFHLVGSSGGTLGAHHSVAHAFTAKAATVGASIAASLTAGAIVISVAQHGPARPLASAERQYPVLHSASAPPLAPLSERPHNSTRHATHSSVRAPAKTSTRTSTTWLTTTSSRAPALRPPAAPVSTSTSSSLRTGLRPAPLAPTSSSSSSAPSNSSSPQPSPSAPAPSVHSAAFTIPVPDPNQADGTVTLTLPAGWAGQSAVIDGLAGQPASVVPLDGSNTVTFTFSNAQFTGNTFTITLSGSGPWVPGDVATADVSFVGATDQTITAPLS